LAYSTPNTISVGDPVKKDDYDKLKNNSINHESRVAGLEVGASTIIVFGETIHGLSGYVNASSTLSGLSFYYVQQGLTLTSAIISDIEGAASSVFEFDILKASTIGGVYSTVFSTKPSVTANGTKQKSTNAVFSVTSIAIGEWLRFDITSVAVGARTINILLTASAT